MSKYEVISGPYFPVFGLNSGKYGPGIVPYLGTFHAVNYNFRNFQELESSLKRAVKFDTETISYRGPETLNLTAKRLRALEPLNKFKKEIKKMEVWCMSMLNVQNVLSTCWLY